MLLRKGPLLLPALGARKEAIVALVPRCRVACEVGADHGITSAALLRQGIAERMIVTDISAASLGKAERLFAMHGLGSQADFRVGDGLAVLDGPVDAIVVAGMGAQTIEKVLRAGRDKIGDAALVLQANLDVQRLRRYLMEAGFVIEAERLAREGGRFYVVLRARAGQAACSEKELLLGPCLLAERPEDFEAYVRWRIGCAREVRGDAQAEAIAMMEEALLG